MFVIAVDSQVRNSFSSAISVNFTIHITKKTKEKHTQLEYDVSLLNSQSIIFVNIELEDHWSCSSPERLSHCKLMRFKLIENLPMKVYAWTLLTPGAWPNLTQGHDWHNL